MFKYRPTIETIDKWLSRFLFFWLALAVFSVPLLIVSYGYSAPGLQQLALTAFALLGALVFLARAFWVRQEFSWRRSPVHGGLAAMALAVIVSSLLSGRFAPIWGLSGFIPQVSPWGILAAILLAVLVIQEANRAGRLRALLAVYALSSALLALFVLGWYFFRNQFLVLWGVPPQAMALWFTVNAVLSFVLSAAGRGRLRYLALLAAIAHAALLFFFDYDLIWYLLAGALGSAGLIAFSFRSHFKCVSFAALQFGIAVAIALWLIPSAWVFGGGRTQFWSGNLVPPSLSWPRYREHIFPDKKLAALGVGAGLQTLSFWQLAELVDLRQNLNLPLPANGYLVLLWEGGGLLSLAFLATLAGLAVVIVRFKRGKREDADSPDQAVPALMLAAGAALASALVAFYFLPITFVHLFTLFFLAGLAAAAGSARVFTWTVGENEERRFAAALATMAPLALAAWLGFVWTKQFQSRLAFLNTITTGEQGNPTVNVDRLQRAIDFAPRAFGYRLSRNDIALQLLAQQNRPKLADVQGLFVGLRLDTTYLANQNLTGPEKWQLAWQAELTGANLEAKEFADQEKGALNAPAKEWYQVAVKLYEEAVSAMPRNVILASEAARFYRQHAVMLATPENGSQKFYDRAGELVSKAISIDPAYEGSYLEKAELAALTKSPSEALAEVAGFAERGPNLSFRAGQLAYAAKNYQQAARYYRKTLDQNAGHLSARYELVRAYAAAGESEQGRQQLAELEKRVDKNNAQIAALLDELRKTVSAVPLLPPTDDKSADKQEKKRPNRK